MPNVHHIGDFNLAHVELSFFQEEEKMRTLVPEWAALNWTCEMNSWHFGESTKVHTLQVIKNVLALLRCPRHVWLGTHLGCVTVDGRSLHELFLWANVLHDIAKPYTQEIKVERLADPVLYPGHEAMGAEMARGILGRLGFKNRQIEWISYIVRWHGDMHGFFGKPEDEFQSRLKDWEEQHKAFLRYLYLHSWADTIGAKLEEWNPAQYDLRLKRYEACLEREYVTP